MGEKCSKCSRTYPGSEIDHILSNQYTQKVCYSCAYKDYQQGKIENPKKHEPVKLSRR